MLRGAALLAIGDELLEGRFADANSPALARALAGLGLEVRTVLVLPDDEPRLAAAITGLAREHVLVVSSGGLGPTLDDVTRHAAAHAAGVALVESAQALALIGAWYQRRGLPMPEPNRRQALIPDGASVLPNERGTAPGFLTRVGGAVFAALPGPPAELQHVLDVELLPRLAGLRLTKDCAAHARLHLFGLSESVFAEQAGDWMARPANPLLAVTASEGRLALSIHARADSVEEARALVATRERELLERFGAHVFSRTEPALERVLGCLCLRHGVRIALAESCTGGLLAARLTSVAGISAVFSDGFVTYSPAAKVERLGVPRELLELHGAVSGPVAEAMARGAAARSGADLALSVTGIAGPGPAGPLLPEGLVWIGIAWRGSARSVERRFPPGDRDRVRAFAANTAFHLAIRELASAGLA